ARPRGGRWTPCCGRGPRAAPSTTQPCAATSSTTSCSPARPASTGVPAAGSTCGATDRSARVRAAQRAEPQARGGEQGGGPRPRGEPASVEVGPRERGERGREREREIGAQLPPQRREAGRPRERGRVGGGRVVGAPPARLARPHGPGRGQQPPLDADRDEPVAQRV